MDVADFVRSPSRGKLDTYRRKDLVSIAEAYQVSVPRHGKREEIKTALLEKLVALKVLPDGEVAVSAQVAGEGAGAFSLVVEESTISAVSPSTGSKPSDPLIAVRLKELELETRRQEREIQFLKVRALEIEAEKALRLYQLQTGPSGAGTATGDPLLLPLGASSETTDRRASGPVSILPGPTSTPSGPASTPSTLFIPLPAAAHSSVTSPEPVAAFDVGKHIKLVPHFRESDVDSYFPAFERIASVLHWPKEVWPLLLQCKLEGKAQEVCAALSLSQSLDYEVVKSSILHAYELVPEAYRQNFRMKVKTASQTYVEFAREKRTLFEKWCSASNVTSFEQLQELILLEDFKNAVHENIVVHLNEKKVISLADAAVYADEFVLTHKTVFTSPVRSDRVVRKDCTLPHAAFVAPEKCEVPPKVFQKGHNDGETRVCFFCCKPGHLIAECKAWQKKRNKQHLKSVGLAQSDALSSLQSSKPCLDDGYKPFLLNGWVSIVEQDHDLHPVKILRDTGAAQSFILESVLPFSEKTFCGSSVLVRGIEMGHLQVPLHTIYLKSGLVKGLVKVAVRDRLPVAGVSLILGNDLAGGKVFPLPEVSVMPETGDIDPKILSLFPGCVVTRAQARKTPEVPLLGTFMAPQGPPVVKETKASGDKKIFGEVIMTGLKIGRKQLIEAQQGDASLALCFAKTVPEGDINKLAVAYYVSEGILKRKWTPTGTSDLGWNTIHQIVIPEAYRGPVLSLAHENAFSGHLGVTKTYDRILRHFFWPGLKSDVSNFCRSCHVCQLVGKPNQSIPSAPLHPIPVMGEPFEKILLDCVGPLPRSSPACTGQDFCHFGFSCPH
ncbi:uncharacterized protein [Hoplias malabaricus]|uniref:uncharacterized protein n=1 Tax=Hoplias malabaricus TaxID=27720 RepID=UPI0034625483